MSPSAASVGEHSVANIRENPLPLGRRTHALKSVRISRTVEQPAHPRRAVRCGVGSFSSESTLEGTRLGTMASARAASLLADALRAVSMDAVLDEPPSDAPTTDSESDWSDAELRESDSHGNGAPPSAAQGMGRPWAHIARARRSRREARARGASMRYQGNDAETRDGAGSDGAGVFLSDLDASAAVHVLACLDPVDRARVTACRRAERAALTHRGHVRVASARSTPRSSVNATPVGSFGGGVHLGASHANGPRFGSGDAPLDGNFGGEGHLADAAWRDVDARGVATPAALATLRNVACGSLVRLDVTGSRGIKRGELLELVRESPRLRDLRVAHLGDTGKFSCGDCELFLAACPSLARFECDVGVSAARVKDKDGVLVPGPAELDLAALLGGRRRPAIGASRSTPRTPPPPPRWRRRRRRRRGRAVRSLDVSWGSNSPAAGGGRRRRDGDGGRGVPLRQARHAQSQRARRRGHRPPRAADRIFRALATRAAKHEAAVAEAARVRAKGEDGHRDARAPPIPEHRKPLSRLRWLDLGSNMIGDRGAGAMGTPSARTFQSRGSTCAITPWVCTGARRSAARWRGAPRSAGWISRTAGSGTRARRRSRGFAAAADAGRSTSLRVLQLGFNSIGVEGIEALVEAHAAGALDQLEPRSGVQRPRPERDQPRSPRLVGRMRATRAETIDSSRWRTRRTV